MNRAARIFVVLFAILIAPLFLCPWHSGVRGSDQNQNQKSPLSAARAPSKADSSPQTSAAPGADKKRIVVLDFDDTAVGTDVLGDKVDVGKEIAGLVTKQLAKDGTYVLVDSKTMRADLAEHDVSKADRCNFEFALKLGKRLAADAVIMGNVTLFGKDRSARPIPQDEVVRRKFKARVAADARIVNVAGGEIVAAASGRGESKREGISLTSGGSNWHDFRSGNFGFGSSEFQETILGEAVNDMVVQLTAALAAEAPRLASGPAENKPGDHVKSATR